MLPLGRPKHSDETDGNDRGWDNSVPVPDRSHNMGPVYVITGVCSEYQHISTILQQFDFPWILLRSAGLFLLCPRLYTLIHNMQVLNVQLLQVSLHSLKCAQTLKTDLMGYPNRWKCLELRWSLFVKKNSFWHLLERFKTSHLWEVNSFGCHNDFCFN